MARSSDKYATWTEAHRNDPAHRHGYFGCPVCLREKDGQHGAPLTKAPVRAETEDRTMALQMADASTKRTARAASASAAPVTHEAFIDAIRMMAIGGALTLGRITAEQAATLRATRIVYGVGSQHGARGVCYYGRWTNAAGATVDLVEIAASTQESFVQLAGTTVHEIAHVLTGHGHGHDRAWADGAVTLGLGNVATGTLARKSGTATVTKRPNAAGQAYTLALFQPWLRSAIVALVQTMTDGAPAFSASMGGLAGLFGAMAGLTGRPCSAGIGTRGGTSRGTGSGSRLRLWECQCARPVKVRVASDTFDATCNVCGAAFARPD